MNLIGTHHFVYVKLLIYWADAYANAFVVASKEFRLEVEDDKTKCMTMS